MQLIPIDATTSSIVVSLPLLLMFGIGQCFFSNLHVGMQGIFDFFRDLGGSDSSGLMPEFVRYARKFYNPPETFWEPVALKNGKIYYLLKGDPHRSQASERFVYLEKECQKLWTRIANDPVNIRKRASELRKLEQCLVPGDAVSRIVQKPLGGYDVRAYAHDSWVFVEVPTFSSVETGADGINLTEEKRRKTLLHILVHELAHVAGYWEHDDKHANCIHWLTKYIDP